MTREKREVDWGNIPNKKSSFKKREVDWGDIPVSKTTDMESTGWSGVGADLINKIKEMVQPKSPEEQKKFISEHGLATNLFANQPEPILPNFLKQAVSLPYEALTGNIPRLTKNIAKGTENTLNIPSAIASYLGEKQIINPAIGEAIHIPEHGYGLEEQQPGDVLAQNLPNLLPISPKGFKSLSAARNYRENALKDALQTIEETKKAHAEYLGQGKEHGAHISQGIVNKLEGEFNPESGKYEGGLKSQLGDEFNAIDKSFEGKKIEVPNEPKAKDIDNLFDIAVKNGLISKDANSITINSFKNQAKEYLQHGKKTKEIDAQDLYRKFRTLTMQATEDKANAFAHGIDPEASYKWRGIAAAKQAEAERIQGLLEKVDPEAFERLKKVKHRWATEYAPARENPLYNEMKKHGQTSKNIMKFLHGKTKGNEILNAIVEKDPKLQAMIVGQQYSKKPQALTEPSELLEKYKNINPNIARLIKEQEQIKNISTNEIPKLEEAVQKRKDKKNFRRGALTTASGLIGGAALDNALGGDWKKDAALIYSILASKKQKKK